MSDEFEQLKEVSDPPDDWEARISVPRVIVGQEAVLRIRVR